MAANQHYSSRDWWQSVCTEQRVIKHNVRALWLLVSSSPPREPAMCDLAFTWRHLGKAAARDTQSREAYRGIEPQRGRESGRWPCSSSRDRCGSAWASSTPHGSPQISSLRYNTRIHTRFSTRWRGAVNQGSGNKMSTTHSPAAKPLNSLFFFGELRFMVLGDLESLQRDVGVVFLHTDHDCRVAHMGYVHFDPTDDDDTGRGARRAWQAGDGLRPLRCWERTTQWWVDFSQMLVAVQRSRGLVLSSVLLLQCLQSDLVASSLTVFYFISLVGRKQNDFWNNKTFFLQRNRGGLLPDCSLKCLSSCEIYITDLFRNQWQKNQDWISMNMKYKNNEKHKSYST